MKTKLIVRNYRCFVEPVTIDLEPGFTAFVGVNNSGKSSMMRFLLECRDIFQKIGPNNGIFQSSFLNPMAFTPGHVVDPDEIFSNQNSGGFEFRFEFEYLPGEQKDTSPTQLVVVGNRNLTFSSSVSTAGGQVDLNPARTVSWSQHSIEGANRTSLVEMSPIYDVAASLANTLYIGSFRNSINIGTNAKYFDIEVGMSFIERFSNLKTGASKQNSEAISNVIKDIQRIFRFNSLSVEAADNNRSLHIDVDGKPYKQHELGSGLIQFLLVLANAATRSPRYILIDEPELGLHPSLQLDFLTTLASYARDGVWFATHSVGLARSSANKIYSVKLKAHGQSVVTPLTGKPTLAQFAGEMSFLKQSELGFEKIVLVEGPTDITSFQQFLRLRRQDHRVLLLSLHGQIHGNIGGELEEIKRITSDVHVIIDSERGAAGAPLDHNRQAFVDLCQAHGIPCHVMDRRAIENYFSDHAIKQTIGPSYRALGLYEHLKSLSPGWSKNDNWKIARAMTEADLAGTDLGAFIAAL